MAKSTKNTEAQPLESLPIELAVPPVAPLSKHSTTPETKPEHKPSIGPNTKPQHGSGFYDGNEDS